MWVIKGTILAISGCACDKRGSGTLGDDFPAKGPAALDHGRRGRIIPPLFCFLWKRAVGDFRRGGGEA